MSALFPDYKGLNLPKLSDQMLDYWRAHDVFEKSVSSREGQKPYVFFEGPPSANGLPGVHHVLARAIKDIFPGIKHQTLHSHDNLLKTGFQTRKLHWLDFQKFSMPFHLHL